MPNATGSGARPPIRRATDPRLAPALLDLHAAMDGEAFWQAGLALLRLAMPANHYVMGLATVGAKPFMLRTTVPTPDEPDYWDRLNRVAPIEKLVARKVGRQTGRMSDDVPFLLLRLTPFYRQFMKPEGWRYSAALFFWEGKTFLGHFAQNRTPAQGDYSDDEMALLGELHPHFETAVRRVVLFDRERFARRSMEVSVQRSPVPMAVLDWDLTLYHNAAAAEASAVWRLGPEPARVLKPAFELPADLGAACRELAEGRAAAMLTGHEPATGRERQVLHSSLPWARATLRLLDPAESQFARPCFLIQFSLLSPNGRNAAHDGLQLLARLTPAQREVALRAAQGLENDEIAGQLAVSRNTVRAHLRQIFKSLGISSRGKLSPLAQLAPEHPKPTGGPDRAHAPQAGTRES